MGQAEFFDESLRDPYLCCEHSHRYWWIRELVRGKRVLDIACGSGYGSFMLAETALEVIGVDRSAAALEIATTHYQRDNLSFLRGECLTFPNDDAIKGRGFDVVVSFETLEHLYDQDIFLKNIAEVLTPDGVAVISTPDRVEYSDKTGFKNEFHVHELDRGEFLNQLGVHFGEVSLYGQRMLPGSFIAEVDSAELRTSGAFRAMGIDTATSARDIEPLSLPAIYLIAICSQKPIEYRPQECSFLADSAHNLRVTNRSDQGEITQGQLDSLPRRLKALVGGLADRLAALEVSHSDALNTIATLNQRNLQLEEHYPQTLNKVERLSGRLLQLEEHYPTTLGDIAAIRGELGELLKRK